MSQTVESATILAVCQAIEAVINLASRAETDLEHHDFETTVMANYVGNKLSSVTPAGQQESAIDFASKIALVLSRANVARYGAQSPAPIAGMAQYPAVFKEPTDSSDDQT